MWNRYYTSCPCQYVFFLFNNSPSFPYFFFFFFLDVRVHKGGLSPGAIAGIVIGIVAVLIIIILLAVFIYSYPYNITIITLLLLTCGRRKKSKRKKPFKAVKVTKENEEVLLDDIVPHDASMIVSASPNLITPGFGTLSRSSLSLTPGIIINNNQ